MFRFVLAMLGISEYFSLHNILYFSMWPMCMKGCAPVSYTMDIHISYIILLYMLHDYKCKRWKHNQFHSETFNRVKFLESVLLLDTSIVICCNREPTQYTNLLTIK